MPDAGQFVLFTLALASVGCVSGFLAGLLGVGGGIVVVPVLHIVLSALGYDLDVIGHVAVGTSLATIVPTAVQSMRTHMAKGAVDRDLLRFWAPFVVAGVVLGILAARVLSGEDLTMVFAVIGIAVALHMSFTPEGTHLKDGLPGRPVQGLLATGIGFFSTLMGIGGGTLTVPTLSLCNYPVRRAIGTASVIGLIISVPGAAGFVFNGWGEDGLPPLSLGYVNLPGFVGIVATSLFFAPLGARTAHRMNVAWLRRVFGLFLGITAVRMLVTALG